MYEAPGQTEWSGSNHDSQINEESQRMGGWSRIRIHSEQRRPTSN